MSPHRSVVLLGVAALVLFASPAAAGGWDAAFVAALPEEALARAAIDNHPDVLRSKTELDLARAQARGLDAGPYEFTVNANNADNYPGFTWDISRTVRLPGKARLDRKVGELGVKAAEDLVDDARHQTGLMLSDAWYAWIEAESQVGLDRETETSLGREVEALRRRVQEKDASQLDLEQAEAAQAAATARRATSEGRAQTTRLVLLRGFPDLALPVRPPTLPEPPVLDPPATAWPDITVRSSHEIAIADFQAQQAEAMAARVRLDRTPDPTAGIRAIPTPGPGGYRINGIGVFVSTPIGGTRRRAAADAEAARASAAMVNLMRVRRESAALGERNAVTTESSRLVWRSTLDAVRAAEAATARTQRGYQLGELDLSPTLVASRQLYDVQKAEITARTDAWRALTHLRLDAHDLWSDRD